MVDATDEIAKVLVAMQQMMAQQQDELKELRKQNAEKREAQNSGSEPAKGRGPTVDSLEKQIRVFTYNPDEGWTFEAWWTRNEDLFEAVNLGEEEKGRMLLRHVDEIVDRQFRDHIRPKKLSEMKFAEVKEVMIKLFGDKKTLFEKRLEMFNLKMSKVHIDDMREFATRVNRVVEDANVTELTPDKIKTMIFLAGVDLPRHTGAMFHIINGMKREESPTLEKILEIADTFKEAQHDSHTVTGQNRSHVNAVKLHGKGKDKPRRDKSTSEDSEGDECGRCGRDHEDEKCPFVNAICHNCGKTGHIRAMCQGKNKGRRPKFNKIKSEQSGNSSGEFDVSMKVNGEKVEMSLDSGSDLTFISESTWILVGSPRARCTDVTPECPNGSIFRVKGKCDVNLEMNGLTAFGEVYITEDTNVLGRDLMQLFFTLMPKGPQAQLNHSTSGVEVTEVGEDPHSGTGLVEDDHQRKHSIQIIEVTDTEVLPRSGNGLLYDRHDSSSGKGNPERSERSASSVARSSMKEDSTHSGADTTGNVAPCHLVPSEEAAVDYCATEKVAVENCANERGSSLMDELKQRVMTGSHSELRESDQMESGRVRVNGDEMLGGQYGEYCVDGTTSRRTDYRTPLPWDEPIDYEGSSTIASQAVMQSIESQMKKRN